MVPIFEIIDLTGNRYLLTKAAMKRARQISFLGHEDLDKYKGKIVSLSLTEMLHGDLKYMLPAEEKVKEKES